MFRNVCGLLLVCLAGCTGRAGMSAVPFTRSDLSDQEPLITHFPQAGTCVWFTDDAGRINLAVKYKNLPLLGIYSQAQWTLWIRAGQPPAGSTLRYRLERSTVRGICTSGMTHQRYEARWGVLVLDRTGKDTYRGRFHISASQQQYSLLTGWAPAGFSAPLLIMVGEFEAVHDEKLGNAIADSINKEDWSGLAPTLPVIPMSGSSRPQTSQPATRPTPRKATGTMPAVKQ